MKLSKSNMVMTVEVTDGEGNVKASQVNTWNGLGYEQVLFMEKHLMGALAGMNDQATELAAQSAGLATGGDAKGRPSPGDIR